MKILYKEIRMGKTRFSVSKTGIDYANFGGPFGGLFRLSTSSGPTSPIRRTKNRVGRNDLCHCGSGQKNKKCCGGK